MKNKILKFTSLALATLLTTASVGCSGGGGKNSTKNYGDKTVLNIGVFDGGLGHAWAEAVAEKFEEKYANTSFEEGKMGVYVDINPQKELFKVASIRAAIEQNTAAEDIYYTCYQFNREFADDGLVLNLNDIINEKVYTESGELADMEFDYKTGKQTLKNGAAPTKSILDKMADLPKRTFNYTTSAKNITPGYYALPYENSAAGFIYDHDLFQEEGWLDYDGIDGLPDNLDDFFDLLDRIVAADCIPYTEGLGYYWKMLDCSFIAQYEGEEAAKLNYTYDGEYTFPGDKQPTKITPANAYRLAEQPGKEKYIEFMRKLTTVGYFSPDIVKIGYNFTSVQEDFILSKNGNGKKRIAMIFEGEWWENEARDNFNYTGGYGKRDFRFFPLPQIDGQKDESTRSLAIGDMTDMVVNAKTKYKDLCRLWVQFVHSESALETFTIHTGAYRSTFKYDLDDLQLANLTPFGRDVYKIKSGQKGVTLFTTTAYAESHPFYAVCPMGGYGKTIASTVLGEFGGWQATGIYIDEYMIKNSGITSAPRVPAQTFIDGMYAYYSKDNWTNAWNGFNV
ncbi:MAG: extracellular solute-binding protein [Candidatus Borkfalkiaceae bacterium]|nr:extracellular solute-binding protein [Christensenellaceae bacterium]